MKVPYEYFCKDCGQLRLCLDSNSTGCGNCRSTRLIIVELCGLDRIKLKRKFSQGKFKKEEKDGET